MMRLKKMMTMKKQKNERLIYFDTKSYLLIKNKKLTRRVNERNSNLYNLYL